MGDTELMKLRFTGRHADDHMVPVAILSETLMAMQKAIYICALQHEQKGFSQRDRIPREFEKKYCLLSSLPTAGSYVVNCRVEDSSADPRAPDDLKSVNTTFIKGMMAVRGSNPESLSKIIPDRTRRQHFSESIQKMAPKAGSGLQADLILPASGEVFPLAEMSQKAKQLCKLYAVPDVQMQTVIGRLTAINFDEHMVTIEYPPSQRELSCSYDESNEDMLLEKPRELIQITGHVILDAHDLPLKIVDVINMEQVDLSPFFLNEVAYHDRRFRFLEPLELTPTLDEDTSQLYCLEHPALGIDVFAWNRADLESELAEQIAFLWDNYALAEDGSLTSDALELKRSLKQALCEVHDAA